MKDENKFNNSFLFSCSPSSSNLSEIKNQGQSNCMRGPAQSFYTATRQRKDCHELH